MSVSLLEKIENAKGRFGADAARDVAVLLERAKRTTWRDPLHVIRLHEAVLFLRAYPQDARLLRLADQMLFAFGARLKGLDRTEFEYAEVSGIAQTGLSTNFNYPFARSLAQRHGRAIDTNWDKYPHPERLARTLARLIPQAKEDWAIAPHADWRGWYQKTKGSLAWLTANVEPETYDLLELPLRWELGNSDASRTRARIPCKKIFFHDAPFLTRKDVTLDAELSCAPIRVKKLSLSKAQEIVNIIIDASAVRYRELYGFEYPDLARILHADLGRGMDLFFFGVPKESKLPNRDYCSGMYFKNGVPIGYVEVMWQERRMEVGFNLYYTFRQGETAWLYLRLIKLFHQEFGATSFVIDPYQLGHENDEAIESGAFWFYYKLGFRPESKGIAALAAREMEKIAANREYRTSTRVLRRLANGPVILRALSL